MKTDFKGVAKRLDDIDLPKIGATIGVGEDEIHAFMDVEAAGSGFDNQGRPKMRFEYHYFYRLLKGKQLVEAVNQGLAFKSWRQGRHPRDMYPILQRAMKINPTIALRSASWGLGQIMGENHEAAGYLTVQSMVKAFMADEENHLASMVKYLVYNNLDDDLRAHRWDVVAYGYNGPQYAKHGYHIKLAKAFEKWSRIRDTEWNGSHLVPPPKTVADTMSTLQVQAALAKHGFLTTNDVDGVKGLVTIAAIKTFQRSRGLKVDGDAGSKTIAELREGVQKTPDTSTQPVQKHSKAVPASIAALIMLTASGGAYFKDKLAGLIEMLPWIGG